VVDEVGAVPGRHWKYQSLIFWQTAPETQVVGPLYPIPPPSQSLKLISADCMKEELTLSPHADLSVGDRNGHSHGGNRERELHFDDC
jgi:hypothetical protein